MKTLKYDLILIFTASLWGLAFPITKFVGVNIDPIPFLAIKFIIAAIALTFVNIKKLKLITLKMLIPCALLGMLLTLHSFLQLQGLNLTSSANCSFISSTNVIFVPIFMFLLFREKPTLNVIVGLFLLTFGFLIISGILTFSPFAFNFNSFNIGDLFTLFAAIFTGLYMIFTNKLVAKYDADLVNYIHFIFAAISASVLWPLFPAHHADLSSPITIFVILYVGLFAGALAFLLLMKAQTKLSAVRVAVLCSLEPIFATIFALFIPNPDGSYEKLTFASVVGGLLILAGVIVTTCLDPKNTETAKK